MQHRRGLARRSCASPAEGDHGHAHPERIRGRRASAVGVRVERDVDIAVFAEKLRVGRRVRGVRSCSAATPCVPRTELRIRSAEFSERRTPGSSAAADASRFAYNYRRPGLNGVAALIFIKPAEAAEA